jgi:hypothetical protein
MKVKNIGDKTMEPEYDLSKMKKRPNPFAKQLKKQITISLGLEILKATYGDQEIEISVSNLTTQLEAIANDPSIQAEIQQIEQEFKITEMDGLTDL